MKNSTILVRKYLLLFSVLLFSGYTFSQTTLYTENFQTGLGGWTLTNNGTGQFSRGTNGAHSTGAVGNYVFSSRYSGNYLNNSQLTATSPSINLNGYTNLVLNLNIWYETESGYDGMKIEYSLNNGSTWNDLGSIADANWYNHTDVDAFNNGEDGWSGSSSGWINRNINLTTENIAFETSTQTRFRVLFASDYSIVDTGVAFDQITIQGNLDTPQPEINITGSGTSIPDGDIVASATDDTDFGSVSAGSTLDHTFTIHNIGTATLNLTGGTPLVDISGDAAFTILTQPGGSTIAAGNSRTFVVRFAPTASGTVTANISIDNNDSNENPYNFRVQGTGVAPLTEGPGGVTNDLALWLKGTDGLGYTDGQPVSLWADQGRAVNATAPAGLEPTYRDAPLYNVNFNPVVDFDNDYNTAGEDFDYSDTNRHTLIGSEGFYTQDMFVVVIPDVNVTSSLASMDVFCGDIDPGTNERDGSGIGYGRYSVRFDNEVISYCVNTTSTTTVPVADRGYGIAHTSTSANYNNVGIINSKNNSDSPTANILLYNANNIGNTEVGLPQYENVTNSRYFLGRSEAFKGSYEGRIAEVITYSAKKEDANLTQERNRIQSYLAIKYGITLGVNGTSQDYVDSDGTLIWDANTGTPAEDVFNYDIAGIGRDDASDLLQKQSRSVNNAVDGGFRAQGVLTIGMGNISNTNNLNTNTDLEDKEFLVWGNDGVDLDNPAVVVDVDMSTDISPAILGGTHVQFNGIARTWKVVEKVGPGGDIPAVEVAILKHAVRTATPPNGRYLMFISDTPNFDPTADYRVMTEGTNELGEAILKTNYDFDDTKYITFGWAPERTFERSVYFNGTSNYVDMEDALDLNPTAFTISAWIRRDVNSLNKSILS
ncbi:choice-of-anchor D domain-containing protein, partial [Bizionia echini]|uniref:choice-of-anchor D domain-containing protein n=1 Tax=Bizionia echini TaxID=649333 RepID=UPI0030DA1435